jgi:hypothetical protein
MFWLMRLLRARRARRPARAQCTPSAQEHARLVDACIEAYVVWRERCVEVQRAYDRWIAGRDQREPAFSTYAAELDSEERAARAYRDRAEQLAEAVVQWQGETVADLRTGVGVRREPQS